jgi:mannose/fructose/N-acetylgalactosamine-specific phosphotransferase system component IIC
MLLFKIIACIVLCLVHFVAFIDHSSLKDLKEKATKGEKKSVERLENIALFLPLIIMFFIIVK